MQKQNQIESLADRREKENILLKKDLAGFQERCQNLENEIQLVKGDNKQKIMQDNQMEREITKLRESNAKQVSQLK